MLALACGMALAPVLLTAQQLPVAPGCNAALSCRQRAFASLNQGGSIGGGVFFGMGLKWDPGFDFFIAGPGGVFGAGVSSERDQKVWFAGPGDISLLARPAREVDGQLFHLRVSLLPPPPTATSVAAPPPTSAIEATSKN